MSVMRVVKGGHQCRRFLRHAPPGCTMFLLPIHVLLLLQHQMPPLRRLPASHPTSLNSLLSSASSHRLKLASRKGCHGGRKSPRKARNPRQSRTETQNTGAAKGTGSIHQPLLKQHRRTAYMASAAVMPAAAAPLAATPATEPSSSAPAESPAAATRAVRVSTPQIHWHGKSPVFAVDFHPHNREHPTALLPHFLRHFLLSRHLLCPLSSLLSVLSATQARTMQR